MEAAQAVENENDCRTIEHDIASGRLYKTYLLCPNIEKYIQIDDLSTVTCQPGFLEQLDKSLDQQSIFFHEENPREKHQFATPSTVMVTLLVPPDFILCVDGILSLKRGQLTKAHVLGMYLFRDSDQFFNNSEFDMASLHHNSSLI